MGVSTVRAYQRAVTLRADGTHRTNGTDETPMT
jgi:hypothetical protein